MSRARPRIRVALVLSLCLGLVVVASSGSLAQEAINNQVAATPHPLGPAVPPELDQFKNDWPAPDGNLAAARDATGSSIDSSNLSEIDVAWTFEIEASTGYGGMTATPIILGDTVYVEDMKSNVFALDRATGAVKWQHRYDIATIGPNGLAAGYGMLYGAIGDTAEVFALDAATGDETWRVKLSNNSGEGIDMAPVVYDNTVYVSTVPGNYTGFYRGGEKGVLYALDASTGQTIWQWDTTTNNLWGNARVNSGGGLWYPPSFDESGNIYFGTGNAGPWPGNADFPNGSSRPGDNDYASSMVSLDPATGSVRWNYNAKPHDLFNLDFQNTPVIVKNQVNNQEVTLAIGSGKTGTVAAVNADTGEVIWKTSVGKHQNDELQEIPDGQTVEVFPGIGGGVETPIAYADGKVFVPVVNLPTNHTSVGYDEASLDFTAGTGELVALNVADGSVVWKTDMPQSNFGGATVSNDVVFTSGMDGVFRAYSADTGDLLWSYRASAGFNASPAIAGDMVIVAAAGPLAESPDSPKNVKHVNQLIAFKIGGASATPKPSPESSEVKVEAAIPAFTSP
jgi:outer membrane protein assembly factor BamB